MTLVMLLFFTYWTLSYSLQVHCPLPGVPGGKPWANASLPPLEHVLTNLSQIMRLSAENAPSILAVEASSARATWTVQRSEGEFLELCFRHRRLTVLQWTLVFGLSFLAQKVAVSSMNFGLWALLCGPGGWDASSMEFGEALSASLSNKCATNWPAVDSKSRTKSNVGAGLWSMAWSTPYPVKAEECPSSSILVRRTCRNSVNIAWWGKNIWFPGELQKASRGWPWNCDNVRIRWTSRRPRRVNRKDEGALMNPTGCSPCFEVQSDTA